MSRLRQLAEGIHSSNENTSTKRYKSGSGSAISLSVDAAADAQVRLPQAVVAPARRDARPCSLPCRSLPSCAAMRLVTRIWHPASLAMQGRVPVAGRCCVVNGRAVMVCGAEPVAALEAAEKFVKQRTQDAPCAEQGRLPCAAGCCPLALLHSAAALLSFPPDCCLLPPPSTPSTHARPAAGPHSLQARGLWPACRCSCCSMRWTTLMSCGASTRHPLCRGQWRSACCAGVPAGCLGSEWVLPECWRVFEQVLTGA